MAGRCSRNSSQRGGTLIEFAFTFIITLVLMFAMIDFARALYSYHFVANASREAARFASVRGFSCSAAAAPCPAHQGDVQAYVTQIVPLGINSAVIANTTWPTAGQPPVCALYQDPGYPGCPVRVKVTYDFNYLFPLYNFAPISFNAATIHMNSTSEMIISR